MENILVAGGAGFLGSHLCKKLLEAGHTVYCLDNLISGSKDNIVTLFDNPKFIFIEHDVAQPFTSVADRMAELHTIFHLASPASPNPASPRSYLSHPIETMITNSAGTHNLLLLAKDKKAKFLFASTSEVYGNPAVSPQPETYFGNVNPNGIRSVYDEGKRFGEALTWSFRRVHNVDARIIRIFNTYGPFMQKDDGRAVSAFITQAIGGVSMTIFGEGNQTRSFCYVDDLIDGIIKAMFTGGTNGEVINLGNPDERTISNLATLVKELTGSQSQIVHEGLPADDPVQRRPDITKAQKLLGWQPKISLEEGLKKTIEYFRTN